MSNKCLLRFRYGSKQTNDELYLLGGLGVLVGAYLWKQNQQIEAIVVAIFFSFVGYLRSMKKKIDPEEVRVHEKGMRIPQSCVETKSYEYDRDVEDNYNLVGIVAEKVNEDLSIRLSPEKRTHFEWKEIRKIQYNTNSTIFILTGGDIVIIQHSQVAKQHQKKFVSLVKEYVEATGGILVKN